MQSHLHLDHTGAIGRFPNAIHVVQRAEYEYAFTPDWFAVASYIRKDFDKTDLQWLFLDGKATDFYDLFGDGTVRLIFTPGHSVGHQSFLIHLPKTGPILLTADAAYTLDHWNEKALPGFWPRHGALGAQIAPSRPANWRASGDGPRPGSMANVQESARVLRLRGSSGNSPFGPI